MLRRAIIPQRLGRVQVHALSLPAARTPQRGRHGAATPDLSCMPRNNGLMLMWTLGGEMRDACE
jgi:hypothetical protein